MKILIAAKILEKRGVKITSLALSELLNARRHSISDRLKEMQPYFLHYGIPPVKGTAVNYQINLKGNKLLRKHLLTETA